MFFEPSVLYLQGSTLKSFMLNGPCPWKETIGNEAKDVFALCKGSFHCTNQQASTNQRSIYHSSHKSMGSVENHPKWKETNIGDTPIFHWTTIVGERVATWVINYQA